MKNMAFSITTKQMYEETKTVTRRIGWWDLEPGDVLMAVEKGMGLKKGEHVKPIYPIDILDTRPEPLRFITPEDVVREGFPEMSVKEFIQMFCKSHKGCTPWTYVNRIEFRKVNG